VDLTLAHSSPILARVALLSALLGACQAVAPSAEVVDASLTVRGETRREAGDVARTLKRLQPELEALVPGVALGDLEVWIQDQPHVYSFPSDMDYDAEGLYAPDLKRILLARGSRDMKRVLAHELTHAALQSPWNRLPGTLEEGLCDSASACLAPGGAQRLRAGRLSGAAFACGGIELRLRITPKVSGAQTFETQVLLSKPAIDRAAAQSVFTVSAGLSSSKLDTESKRAFYGLSFLVVDRVVQRGGFDALYRLCQRAEAEGLEEVPAPWILDAAQLESTEDSWRAAALQAFGNQDLVGLIGMYPDKLAERLAEHILSLDFDLEQGRWWDTLSVECSLVQGTASTKLNDLWPMRVAVSQALRR